MMMKRMEWKSRMKESNNQHMINEPWLRPCTSRSVVALLGYMLCVPSIAEQVADVDTSKAIHAANAAVFPVARWIAPPAERPADAPLPLVRKDFVLDEAPRKATLRVVGLGDYDPRFNGTRLAETGMNQPWSQYEKTLYYRDYEITQLVQPGKNTVGNHAFQFVLG
jgi:hypothetical protein